MFNDTCCAVAIARHFSLLKLRRRRVARRLIRSAALHEVSLLCFGLLFVRKRLGGGAAVAELAERLRAGVAMGRGGALPFDELIVRRVFGGQNIGAMVRDMRAEMVRMVQARQVGAFMAGLQVICYLRGGGGWVLWLVFGALMAAFVFVQAEARCRLAGEGAPGVVAAARCGNADAVELHVIADAGAVHALDR